MHNHSAASALVRALQAEGVDLVFGYPGGAILPIYDALYQLNMRHVLTRHEQGAVHAAEGYAKASGRVGVVMATSGPGAINLTTGLLDALMDSVPIVAITGQVPRGLIGRDAFQEADVLGVTMPVTKHNYLVQDPADLLPTVHEAFHLATTGRPGPVVIDIPKDVSNAPLEYVYPPALAPWLKAAAPQPEPALLAESAAWLAGSDRPLVICGGGVVSSPGAPALLLSLVERLQLPVAMTLHGLGGFPGDHRLSLGLLGMHGLYAANQAVQNAEVILAVGMRFDDRVTGRLAEFAPKAKIIHIDIDHSEFHKNVPAHISLHGDASVVLQGLHAALPALVRVRTDAWCQQLQAWHYQHPVWIERRRTFRTLPIPSQMSEVAATALDGTTAPVNPPRPEDVLRAVQTVFGPESIVVTDVGQHQMWAAHFCMRREPRTFLCSGGLGTMGFGLPAGIGAQLSNPGKPVIVVAGDGGFQMTLAELGTVAAERLPLKILVINNGYLGMVRQWQQLFYDRRYSAVDTRPGQPDFAALARAYGIEAITVTQVGQVPEAILQAQQHQGPFLIDFRVLEEENVYPMVAPGEGNDNMILG